MKRIDYCKNSKKSSFVIIALLLLILTSCGVGGGDGSSSLSSSSLVTITVGSGGQTASLNIEKNTLLTRAKRFLRDFIKIDTALAAIPSDVFNIIFTISAPDMATMTKDVSVLGQTSITETFIVPNGSNRYFLVEAKNATAVVLYSGSAYADLDGGTVTLDIIMMSKKGTITLTATSMITEAAGQTITYTAIVDHAPQGSDLVLTLSNGWTITIPMGQTTGSAVGISAGDPDVYVDPSTLTASITGATGGNYTELDMSDTATTVVTDTTDATVLTLSAPGTVVEGGQITYTATLTNPPEGDVTVTLSNGETITIAAGATSGSVTVDAPGDDVYNDTSFVTVSITSATGGNFESLVFDTAAFTTTTQVTDTNDPTTVTLSAPGTVLAGEQITYTATLTNPPESGVTVTLSNGETITIAAGATSGGVTVVAPGSAGFVDVSIIGATGGNFENLFFDSAAITTIAVTDNATVLTLSAPGIVVEGGQITYTATLTNPPESDVTVTLSNGETITIAAGAMSGSVTVAAPGDDVYIDADFVDVTIVSATGGNFESLAFDPLAITRTIVTDTIDTTTMTLSAPATVYAGGTITYTATLSNPPQGAVIVTLSNGATITISYGATSGSVAVVAPGSYGYVDVSIIGATGGNFENLFFDSAVVTTIVMY